MPGVEGSGPSPEEQGVVPEQGQVEYPDTQSTQIPITESEPAAPTPESAPTEPAKKPLKERLAERFERGKERRREKKEQAEIRKNLARARERRVKGYAEIIKHGARTPQELQDLLADISFKDLKEAQDRNKYGGGAVGKLKAFLAGEHDFQINDDETVREYYQTLNDLRQEIGAEPSNNTQSGWVLPSSNSNRSI